MRMWMLPPEILCRQHLLGEHGEIHKHRKMFEKGTSIRGRIAPIVLIEPAQMKSRHDVLAKEMVARGMNHQSPYELPDLSAYTQEEIEAKVDLVYNLNDLISRCPNCRQRYEVYSQIVPDCDL